MSFVKSDMTFCLNDYLCWFRYIVCSDDVFLQFLQKRIQHEKNSR